MSIAGSVLGVLMTLACVWGTVESGSSWNEMNQVQDCGSKQFNISLQCCCDGSISDIPEHDCQCCGTKGYRRSEPKPQRCLWQCGTQQYHPHTQLCCDGLVLDSTDEADICCGRQVVSRDTHVCCKLSESRQIALDKRDYSCCGSVHPRHLVLLSNCPHCPHRNYSCCGSVYPRHPYHLRTMRCDRKNTTTSLKRRQLLQPGLLCQGRLPVYDVTWPTPLLLNNSHTHIRAIPESCGVSVKCEASGSQRITIPFSSFAIVGRHPEPACLAESLRMELVVRVRPEQAWCCEQQLKDYLDGKVLDVYVRKRVICGKVPERPLLRLKSGHNAVVFLAGSSRDLMALSLNHTQP